MIHPRVFAVRHTVLTLCLAVVACGGDTPVPEDDPADAAAMAAALEAHKAQKLIADSVVEAAPDMSQVVEALGGTRYQPADSALSALVVTEAAKTRDCYTKALAEHDPNLTAVLYVLVNFGAAGWDLMRVERWSYSSPAGGAVVTCINSRAKNEWQLPTRGIKPGAYLVRLVYRPDDNGTP
jgi:hypothetical protein